MTEGARTTVQYSHASTKGQAGDGSSPHQQIESLLGWVEAEAYLVALGQLGVEPREPERSPDDA
jgi:hypothetical protein